jgi:hypothetical protein
MESIQQQISVLTHKIDRIYQILDSPQERQRQREVALDLDAQIVGGEETSIKHPRNRDESQRVGNNNSRRIRQDGSNYNSGSADLPSGSNYRRDTSEWIIAQQDVLIDSSGIEVNHHQIKEQDLAPQIQIQRLTAQLTAAYNRIAALEEQLLARRWK